MFWSNHSGTVAMALVSLTLTLWPAGRAVASSRLRRLSPDTRPVPGGGQGHGTGSGPDTRPAIGRAGAAAVDPSGGALTGRRRAMIFAGVAGAAVLATFPSVAGGLGAVTASVGSYLLLRGRARTDIAHSRANNWLSGIRWPGASAGRSSDADPALPFAIDLLAVCLRGGMPTSAALKSVAGILPVDERAGRGPPAMPAGPQVCVVLSRVAAASELGSEPATAWGDWIGHPVYGPLARALVVTGESGSAVAGRMEAVSQRLRTASGQQAMTRAQRAGVALMAPLGLCFLPAFVCLGVVPVVVGIASQVFG